MTAAAIPSPPVEERARERRPLISKFPCRTTSPVTTKFRCMAAAAIPSPPISPRRNEVEAGLPRRNEVEAGEERDREGGRSFHVQSALESEVTFWTGVSRAPRFRSGIPGCTQAWREWRPTL